MEAVLVTAELLAQNAFQPSSSMQSQVPLFPQLPAVSNMI